MESLTWSDFERSWTRSVVSSINKVRSAEGITVEELTRRLNDGGWPVSKATVSGIVSGNKRTSISIAELSAFAWALSVPPLYLLMGLPDLEALPESPLWNGQVPNPPFTFQWWTGLSAPTHYPSDSVYTTDAERASPVPSLTRSAMEDIGRYGTSVAEIRWRAAQLVALDELNDEELTSIVGTSIATQASLWRAIRGAISARAAQQKVSEDPESRISGDWTIDLDPLPEQLAHVERDDYAEDLTIDELRSLTTADAIERAKQHFRRIRAELSGLLMRGNHNAPPS